jgi:alkanesulfonate monooxygenase SsuD/methylene tetrahydromethanopterin reductase-like flavin-dependent oxidoreductase (luciferase family)
VMVGVNVIAADTVAAAREQLREIRRIRAVSLHGRRLGVHEQDVTDEQADELLAAGVSVQVDHMLTYTAAGTPREVRGYLDEFVAFTGADELITVHQVPGSEGRLRSVILLAEAMQRVPA